MVNPLNILSFNPCVCHCSSRGPLRYDVVFEDLIYILSEDPYNKPSTGNYLRRPQITCYKVYIHIAKNLVIHHEQYYSLCPNRHPNVQID